MPSPCSPPCSNTSSTTLEQMLTHDHNASTILYYEVLDMSQEELDKLKTVEV